MASPDYTGLGSFMSGGGFTPKLSNATFGDIGGAASDIFAGFGAANKADLQGLGLNITAAGTRTQAMGTRTQAEGTRIGADSTRIGAEATEINADSLRTKAAGDIAEATNYDLAAGLARENETFTEASNRIQQFQLSRNITSMIGTQRAGVAASGFSSSGSALDIMRDSAAQGALSKGVLGMQNMITEAGFEEQAKSFDTMSAAGRATAAAEMAMAGKTDVIAADQRAVAGKQDLLANSQDAIAAQQDQIASSQDVLAAKTREAGKQEATGDFIGGAIKGAAAIATLFI